MLSSGSFNGSMEYPIGVHCIFASQEGYSLGEIGIFNQREYSREYNICYR